MNSFTISLFFDMDNKNKRIICGRALFKENESKTRSQLFISGLEPNDTYLFFYIMENSEKLQSAVEMGMASVNRPGRIELKKDLDNKILDNYCYKEKKVVAVIAIEKHDKELLLPIVGFRESRIEWKPMVSKYITSLECNFDNPLLPEYKSNQEYDCIINSLPDCCNFKNMKYIDKAVVICDYSFLFAHGILTDSEILRCYPKIMFVRLKTQNAVLYLIGLPDKLESVNQLFLMQNNFNTFIPNCDCDTDGYWCKYIMTG